MRVQFNLLPDVKQQYIGAERTKKTVLTVALFVSAGAFTIFLFMAATVYIVNKKQLNDAGKDISRYTQEINDIPEIDKILTVQSQLESLLTLHQQKHISSRLFTYLPQLTPANVHMGRVNVDFSSNTMEISGTADSQKTINTFIDTLKFTTYKVNGQSTGQRAFPSVLESSFGLDEDGASYTLTIQFDPVLFSNSQKVELEIPEGLETTRSVLENPNTLFDGQVGAEESGEGN